jgi:putative tryptophan/tyrosine transport system substrate-binding protein
MHTAMTGGSGACMRSRSWKPTSRPERFQPSSDLWHATLAMHTQRKLADPIGPLQVRELEEAAKHMGLRLQIQDVRTTDDLGPAFELAAKSGAQGLFTTLETFFIVRRARIAELAAQYRLPAMYSIRDFPESGGLMSYGPNSLSLYRQTAAQVDKVLKGAKPADLPVEQPTKFELVINMKAAKALGLTSCQGPAYRPRFLNAGPWCGELGRA